jgi:hypothetical protein
MRIPISVGVWIATGVFCFAGEKEVLPPAPICTPAELAWSANFEGGYTFGSRFRNFGDFGSQAEYHYTIQATRRFSLEEGWFFKIGFAEEQFQFSRSDAFLPYSLPKVAGQFGFGSSLTDSLRWEADVFPGVYYTHDDITENPFDAGTTPSRPLITPFEINEKSCPVMSK